MPVDEHAFKEAMAQFPTGVTVVTTTWRGMRYGMTVSAFASVSVEPPLVLACLGNAAQTRPQVEQSGCLGIHILAQEQAAWGKRFAGLEEGVDDPFDGLQTRTALTGAPILPDCLAWLDCEVDQIHPGGDHIIVVARVVAVEVEHGRQPLLYHDREWKHVLERVGDG